MNKPTYKDSFGNRYTTDEINRKSNESAKLKLQLQLDEHGYNFCEHCKRNDCKPIDVSHTISRKEAKENGCVEVLWDIENMEILGRKCHQIKDKLL
tara:strand:- start:131 stop:418 length:288 start_codon:yes stop_codon:yes gene_type:complete